MTTEPVQEADLNRILEAGQMAPSWVNFQVWEIIIVRDPALKTALAKTLPDSNPAGKALRTAPVVLAACGRKGKSGFYKGSPATALGDWLLFDLGLFMQNIALAAHALGYGTVHVGLFDHHKAAALLQVPSDYQLVELMPLGRPERPPGSGPKRRAVSDFSHHDRFGNKP